jgi:hypothetical protein
VFSTTSLFARKVTVASHGEPSVTALEAWALPSYASTAIPVVVDSMSWDTVSFLFLNTIKTIHHG